MFFQVFTSIFHYAVPWNHPSTVEQVCASSIPIASNLIKFCYFCNFSTFLQMLSTAAHLALIAFRLNSFGRFPLCFIYNMNVSAKSSDGSEWCHGFHGRCLNWLSDEGNHGFNSCRRFIASGSPFSAALRYHSIAFAMSFSAPSPFS